MVLSAAVALALTAALGAGPTTGPATAPATMKAPNVSAARASAPKPVPTADPMVDTPTTVEGLLKMQKQVEEVVKKCLPATVAILTADGEGSGIVISKDGMILTAAHVIEKPGILVTIVFPDEKRTHVLARTLGTDHASDTGLLKITKAGDYPFVEVGESGPLKMGEWVVALGHPGGYQFPRPPVARLGRILQPSASGASELRTDCTLIMGDSGGPLLDLEGHVVGIHSKISIGSEENMHVPVDLFVRSWTRLARGDDWGGPVQVSVGPGLIPGQTGAPAWIGVSVEDDASGQCRITKIGILHPPSEKAGLKEGDVVTKFNGKAVANSAELADLLQTARVGRETSIDILRDGVKMTLKITPVAHS
jgi:serine protease Do